MSYSHLLVAVAVNSESHLLLKKAVSIARPYQARISLLTLANDPEMYNQFAAPMMENLRDLMQEETQYFMNELIKQVDYPIAETIIASGAVSENIVHLCERDGIDLVIYGNHNQRYFSRAACSAKGVVGVSRVDVLLVPLGEE
ncbi:universal stress protein UspC [Pseudescherichia sp. L3]|uniref:universal stress protein UspC n=1 Tax=Pseudescherichia sp. L3 TaxID=2970817 RepID=UPI00214F6885|nr:universal stress protein UspC [Pseudescherichia sp. L3]MCR4457880.1 universal stress protein UspC [Pseudescherichia sp. L3]